MNIELLRALHDLEKEKGIDIDVLFEAVESAILSAYKRDFGSNQNAKVVIERKTGNCKVLARKEVVEEVKDKNIEISIDDAKKIYPNYRLKDFVEVEVTPQNFGRIATQTAKQVIVQRIKEAERNMIYNEYVNRTGEIITGIVQRVEQRSVYIDLGKTEALILPQEQVPSERYVHGMRIKTYIIEVRNTTKGPQILVSRTHPGLLKGLFEMEVPEIQEGIVELKSVAREPGSRAKIAVHSKDINVDAVGACVGSKGIRVNNVVDELNGEKIDIVKWDPDDSKFIANSLAPSKVIAVEIWENEKIARVIVPDHQLSLAIGKEGQNVRLAAKLTGWKIDIKSETQMKELSF